MEYTLAYVEKKIPGTAEGTFPTSPLHAPAISHLDSYDAPGTIPTQCECE